MSEILINQLFAGAYLQEGANIGHEVINLFRDDNNENYLFITPSGEVKNHDVSRILFVQNIKARETMEVIMKAENLTPIADGDDKTIYYAGLNIIDIFKKNIYHGELESASNIVATYRAGDIRFPKSDIRIILTVDSKYVDDDPNAKVIYVGPNKSKIVGQGMRTYLSKDEYADIFNKINKLLDDDTLWGTINETQKMISEETQIRPNISFLEIIRKENDELIMSNLLAYYFNYNHKMFAKFAKEVLGIIGFSTSFEIVRETMKNIDMWIRDENQVLVIENKIKSGVNSKTDDGNNQLNKYYNFTESYIKENRISKANYFIFSPNYNDIYIENTFIKNKYKIINYSEIYDFFKKNASEYINDKYFPDFLESLRKHTMNYSELRFSIMRSRFFEKINQR